MINNLVGGDMQLNDKLDNSIDLSWTKPANQCIHTEYNHTIRFSVGHGRYIMDNYVEYMVLGGSPSLLCRQWQF